MFRAISPIIRSVDLYYSMHGTTDLKFAQTKQAKEIHACKNAKRKLHRAIAAI
jgi:hypothetical protein